LLEEKMESNLQPMRRSQADLGARLDKLQTDVQSLLAAFEDSKYFSQKTYGEAKTLRESSQARYDDLDKKMMALNKAVGDLGKLMELGGKKIDNWDKNVEDWRRRVDDWEKKVRDLGKKVDQLENSVKLMK